MGWFLWGLLCTALLTDSWTVTFWIWGVVLGGAVIFGFYKGYQQTKEEKKLMREQEAYQKFVQSVNSLQEDEYNPRHRYCANITFNNYVRGAGFYTAKTSDSIDRLKERAKSFNTCCHVVIRENRAGYPDFDWVTIEDYHLSGR